MNLVFYTILIFTKNPDSTVMGLPENVAAILIPAIVTIIIFVLGVLIGWIKKKSEKKDQVTAYKKIILNWIDQIDPVVNQQITACSDFSNRLSNASNIQSERLSFNKFLVDKVEEISIVNYIDTFVINSTDPKGNNYSMIFKLIAQLKFLKDVEVSISETYKSYQNQLIELMDEWNSNFADLDALISNESKRLASNGTSTQFHSDVLQLANQWRNQSPNGRSSVTFSKSNLIDPLQSLVKQELNSNPGNDYAFSLSNCLQELQITFINWQHLNNDFSKSFAQISDNIQKSYSALNEAKSHFYDNTSIKNVFKIS